MHRIVYVFLFFVGIQNLSAQDDYHTGLMNYLNSEYGVSNGDWLMANTEIANLASANTYGVTPIQEEVTDEDFTRKVIIDIPNAAANPWEIGRFNKNTIAIEPDDKVLVSFYIRSRNGPGRANIFAEHSTTFAKEFFFDAPISEEWRRYFISFESSDAFAIGTLNMGFHFGAVAQTIEIAGYTAINFKDNVNINDLPNDVQNDKYGGYESDAPWRAEAAESIENIRKATLTVVASNSLGQPIQSGVVDVIMKQHKFKFGSAVKGCAFAGNNCQNENYESRIANLAGPGKGFNTIVFENDLKWPTWEDQSLTSHTELVNCLDWLEERNIETRGHALLWPGNSFLPGDIVNSTDVSYIKTRIDEHLQTILNYPGYKGRIPEWDVLNEIVLNRDLENLFRTDAAYKTGRELYVETLEKARAEDPNLRLYVNDYVTLTLNSTPTSQNYTTLKTFLGEIIDAGAPLDGIGFQSHIGGFPNSIYDVQATFDDFYNSFGLKAKVTEFDLPTIVGEELAANYLRDFMTITYAHPSMEGFLFWSFWDGATYMNPGANLFRQDWTRTPAGDIFVDLLFNQWWTDETIEIENGSASISGFKGLYDVHYECNGELIEIEIELFEDESITITCDQLGTSTLEIEKSNYKLYPNPSTGTINIDREKEGTAQIVVHNFLGQQVLQKNISDKSVQLNISTSGVYTVELDGNIQRVIID